MKPEYFDVEGCHQAHERGGVTYRLCEQISSATYDNGSWTWLDEFLSRAVQNEVDSA